ncbi:MAG: hypothetical protein ACMUIS_12075, partial [bacterium]
LWILMVFIVLLTWMRVTAGAKMGTEHSFLFDIPASYNLPLCMYSWNPLLAWKGMAGAKIEIEYPLPLDIPGSYRSSLGMPLWNAPFSQIGTSPADHLSHTYYTWLYPSTLNYIPLWSHPWLYCSSPSNKIKEPFHPVFENLSLFKMGPLYAQIDEPYRYLFIADYTYHTSESLQFCCTNGDLLSCTSIFDFLLDPAEFLLFVDDPNDQNDQVVRYWMDLGADPALFGENDPHMAALFDRASFKVDLDLPIFADPNLRFGGHLAERIIEQGHMGWKVSVNGSVEGQPLQINPLPVDPYDGMPTYLPANHNTIDVIYQYQRPCFPRGMVLAIEAALWNSGVSIWPNVAALDYTPIDLEELMVTIEVTNGIDSEVSTFPITVLDYPVENYDPVPASDDVEMTVYVGELGLYAFQCIDPDCFIFSQAYNLYGEIPDTTHVPGNIPGMEPRDDMCSLVWDLPEGSSYSEIDLYSGLISWVPKYEVVYTTVVTCSDNRGGTADIELKISSECRGGSPINQPIIITGGPTQPVTTVAGQEFILGPPDFSVEDPDGDEIYVSCNIGSCERDEEGNFIWKFQSDFPGSYNVEIIFYDIRGGYALMEFFLDVKPWWVNPS